MKLLGDHGEPFEVAIVAYALLLSKASTAEAAFGILARHARREGNWPFLRVCICFFFFFKHLGSHRSLRGPEDDLIKVETCRSDNILFLLCIKCCVID